MEAPLGKKTSSLKPHSFYLLNFCGTQFCPGSSCWFNRKAAILPQRQCHPRFQSQPALFPLPQQTPPPPHPHVPSSESCISPAQLASRLVYLTASGFPSINPFTILASRPTVRSRIVAQKKGYKAKSRKEKKAEREEEEKGKGKIPRYQSAKMPSLRFIQRGRNTYSFPTSPISVTLSSKTTRSRAQHLITWYPCSFFPLLPLHGKTDPNLSPSPTPPPSPPPRPPTQKIPHHSSLSCT